MKTRTAILASTLLLFTACTDGTDDGIDFESETPDLGKSDHLSLELTPILAQVGDIRTTGGLQIITSAARYESVLGAPAPADVDFDNEWVAFFGIGTRNTGGFGATITRVDHYAAFGGIVIRTQDSSPGLDCFVTQAITFPFALVKFDIPAERPNWYATRGTSVSNDCFTPPGQLQSELADARAAYDAEVARAGENYTYTRVSGSVFGFSFETTFVVEDGVVVERHLKGTFTANNDNTWSEFGADVGSHDNGHPVQLLEDLYNECTDVLTHDPRDNFLHYSSDDNGLLQACTFTNRLCQDDCQRGPTLTSVEFN